MTFRDAQRIIERRLEAVFTEPIEYPDAPVSSAFGEDPVVQGGPPKQSVQERWIERYGRLLSDRALVMEILAGLGPRDKRIIGLRYGSGLDWDEIPEYAHCSRASVYRTRERVFAALYGAMRLWAVQNSKSDLAS